MCVCVCVCVYGNGAAVCVWMRFNFSQLQYLGFFPIDKNSMIKLMPYLDDNCQYL